MESVHHSLIDQHISEEDIRYEISGPDKWLASARAKPPRLGVMITAAWTTPMALQANNGQSGERSASFWAQRRTSETP